MKLASRIDNHDFAVFGEIPASVAKRIEIDNLSGSSCTKLKKI